MKTWVKYKKSLKIMWDIVKDPTNDEAYKNINIFAMEDPITLKGVKSAFGESIEDEVRNFFNLYSSKDDALEWFYPMMEGNDTALGQTGAQYGISLPTNYRERDVQNNITALCVDVIVVIFHTI
jgi:hypothetical protein